MFPSLHHHTFQNKEGGKKYIPFSLLQNQFTYFGPFIFNNKSSKKEQRYCALLHHYTGYQCRIINDNKTPTRLLIINMRHIARKETYSEKFFFFSRVKLKNKIQFLSFNIVFFISYFKTIFNTVLDAINVISNRVFYMTVIYSKFYSSGVTKTLISLFSNTFSKNFFLHFFII